jgi:hypothetical protein
MAHRRTQTRQEKNIASLMSTVGSTDPTDDLENHALQKQRVRELESQRIKIKAGGNPED